MAPASDPGTATVEPVTADAGPAAPVAAAAAEVAGPTIPAGVGVAAGGLPRGLIVLLGGASAVIVAAGLQALAWLVGPVFLALVIVIVVHPVQGRLRRLGLPSWATVLTLIVLVYGLLLVLTGIIVVSVARLATILPSYAAQATALISSLTTLLAGFGVGPTELAEIAESLNLGRIVNLIAALLLGLSGLVGNFVFVLSLLLFLSIEASGAGTRLARIAEDRASVAAALGTFAWRTRRFLAVTTVVGLVTGTIDAVALAALGIPLAVLWGLLAFITNYIPYVGFFIGVIPPALLALLEGGPRLMLVVIVVYTVVNFVLSSIVQPRIVGDAVGISVTVTVIALVFWGWLLGPLGAVLAIPLTLLVKALLVDVDPRARWADALICSVREEH